MTTMPESQNRKFLSAVLATLLVLIVFSITTAYRKEQLETIVDRQEKELKILYQKIYTYEQVHVKEEAIRKEIVGRDSLALIELKRVKTIDSLTQVRKIGQLLKEFDKLNEAQTDSTLIAEFKNAMKNE